jgi:hypothetical protein
MVNMKNMKKMAIAFLVVLAAAVLSTAALVSPRRSHFQAENLEAAVTGLGYKIINISTGSSCWDKWEKVQFGLLSKRELFIKSVKPVPGTTRYFYRFNIWEECYSSQEKAQARLLKLQDVPACAPVEQKEYWMAEGFQRGPVTYILSTDAVMFEEEMGRLAKRLEEMISDGAF